MKLEAKRASDIKMRAAKWLWTERVPLGSLTLLAGAEGIGKSSLTYALIAQVTTGTLEGVYYGQPKSVGIIATEDSWEHTIVPRLMAAGADLTKVFNIEVETHNGTPDFVQFPGDIEILGEAIRELDIALLILDPLMSRIGNGLDTHKDQEVRQALEPLVAMANRSGASVLGIIHINKRNSTDALNNLMGSRAFSAVARAVLYVAEDQEDRSTKYMSVAKSNLGPSSLPDLKFKLEGKDLGPYEGDDPIYEGLRISSSYLVWTGEQVDAVRDTLNYKRERKYASTGRKERIVDLVKEKPDLSKKGIWREIGGNYADVREEIGELLEDGDLVYFATFKIRAAEDSEPVPTMSSM